MTKVLYKPVGMLVSVLGGVLAGAIFKQVWKIAFSEDDAPKATDADRSWRARSSAWSRRRSTAGPPRAPAK
jgi:hypothetical protein